MIIKELKNPLPMNTPKGKGTAIFMVYEGQHQDTRWVVILDNCEIWEFENPQVTIEGNYTMGRKNEQKGHAEIHKGK